MPDYTKYIQEAKAGQEHAFKYLLDLFWRDVYRFQLKRTGNEYEAEEITIQTFSKAFEKISTFKESYNFKTWLITISKNIQIDLSRVKSATTANLIDFKEYEALVDENDTAEDQIIREQNLNILLYYLKQLKPNYEQVIRLRYFREMSYKEIAQYLDEPLGNIKVKLLRAKKMLADKIKNTPKSI